jgi:hypothetical protein
VTLTITTHRNATHNTRKQRVNLAQLSAKERTAFFINVYNVLAIHGFVVTGFPRCQLDWRYFARTACYDIAGLPFSLDEIHHGLLRYPSPSPSPPPPPHPR